MRYITILFNPVPLRRKQPCPTMPRMKSRALLCSSSLFRTPSQQNLYVLLERDLCLFFYLPVTDLCLCRLIDVYSILWAVTQYYFCCWNCSSSGHWHLLKLLPGCSNLPINVGLLYLSASSISANSRCRRLTLSISYLVLQFPQEALIPYFLFAFFMEHVATQMKIRTYGRQLVLPP